MEYFSQFSFLSSKKIMLSYVELFESFYLSFSIKTTNDYQISVKWNTKYQSIILFLSNFKLILVHYRIIPFSWCMLESKLKLVKIQTSEGFHLFNVWTWTLSYMLSLNGGWWWREMPWSSEAKSWEMFCFFSAWGAQGMLSICDIRVMRILSPMYLTAVHQGC